MSIQSLYLRVRSLMSSENGQSGYTIIEVSLFLAISGLLVLIAFIGTGTTIQATRFTDSSRSLHAYVQKQYDNIVNGVNVRTGNETCSAGIVDTGSSKDVGTTDCLLLGKLIVMSQNQSSINTYDVVGSEPVNVNYNKSDEELIYDFQPKIVRNVGVDNYKIPWEAKMAGNKRSIDGSKVDALAMIRSPRSTRVVLYSYEEPSSNYSLASLINPSVSANDNNFVKSETNYVNFCLQSADAFGALSKIVVTGSQGQDAFQLNFDVTGGSGGDCSGS